MLPFRFHSEEERAFVEWYKKEELHKYERPSVTADIAVFSIADKEIENTEQTDERKLKLLLIKRGGHPCKDMYALPGGFANPNETVDEAAARELKEETGIDCDFLEQVRFFSDPGRDPRCWTMTCCYLALLDTSKCKVQAGDDAKEARWFDVAMEKKESLEESEKIYWELKLKHGEEELHAVLADYATSKNIYPRFDLVENENIAFDHGLIIAYAVWQFREWMREKKL